jgi:hypothetical protein
MLLQRYTCSPSSNKPLKGSMEQKRHANETTGDIYKRLLMKIDKISDDLDEHSIIHLTSRHRGVIDLTPWVVSISSSFLLFGLYNYVY